MTAAPPPYNSFNQWLRKRHGARVQRLCVDGGFTCPNRDGTKSAGGCSFCDAGGSGAGHIAAGMDVAGQVRRQIDRVQHRYGRSCRFIVYFQAFTSTYASVDQLRRVYDASLCDERIVGLSVGTRADCLTPEICALLASYVPRYDVWVEIGLQSVNQATLDRVNRAERVEDFERACAMAKAAGLGVVAHLIFGLPGDAREDCLRAADLVNRCGVDGVKIMNLYIHASAPMAAEWRAGRVGLMERDEYVALVCDALERLEPSVLVHRLTGECPAPELLAPAWAGDKHAVLNAIHAELARRRR